MVTLPEAISKDIVNAHALRLVGLLRTGIARTFSAVDRVTISFSGGLDSTLLARLSQEFGRFDCVVAGASGSTDIANAEKAAETLGVSLRKVELTEESVIADIRRIVRFSGVKDPVFVSFEIPLITVLRESENEVVMTGQGGDELFGGYSKYSGLEKSEFRALQRSDIQRLTTVTIPSEDRIALQMGRRIERPFMSEPMVSFAGSLDVDLLMLNKYNKRLIRQALTHLGLERISGLPKKAAQYGSGAMKIMRNIAKSKGVGVQRLIEELAVSR